MADDKLLLENGDFLLLETDDKLLLEGSTSPFVPLVLPDRTIDLTPTDRS